jgi:hypothetical protein
MLANLLGHGTGQLGRAHAGGRLGHTVDSAETPILNKKSFFFFKSVL